MTDFQVGDIIEGKEVTHSMRNGRQVFWHRITLLEVDGNRLRVEMADHSVMPHPFWVTVRPGWFRKIQQDQ